MQRHSVRLVLAFADMVGHFIPRRRKVVLQQIIANAKVFLIGVYNTFFHWETPQTHHADMVVNIGNVTGHRIGEMSASSGENLLLLVSAQVLYPSRKIT